MATPDTRGRRGGRNPGRRSPRFPPRPLAGCAGARELQRRRRRVRLRALVRDRLAPGRARHPGHALPLRLPAALPVLPQPRHLETEARHARPARTRRHPARPLRARAARAAGRADHLRRRAAGAAGVLAAHLRRGEVATACTPRSTPPASSATRATDEYLKSVDLVLLDIKSWDPETYRRVTRQEVAPTLRFAERLAAMGKPVWVRYVLVPGLTDDPANVEGVAKFVAPMKNVEWVEVLPFHQLGAFKWKELGLDYQLADTPPASAGAGGPGASGSSATPAATRANDNHGRHHGIHPDVARAAADDGAVSDDRHRLSRRRDQHQGVLARRRARCSSSRSPWAGSRRSRCRRRWSERSALRSSSTAWASSTASSSSSGWPAPAGIKANLMALIGVLCAGAVSLVFVKTMGIDLGYALGLFAGSGTSTPTLQAAIATLGNDDPAVGYSVVLSVRRGRADPVPLHRVHDPEAEDRGAHGQRSRNARNRAAQPGAFRQDARRSDGRAARRRADRRAAPREPQRAGLAQLRRRRK